MKRIFNFPINQRNNIAGIVLAIALLIIPLSWGLYERYCQTQPQHLPLSGILQVKGHALQLEVASTLSQKIKGLAFRPKPLPATQGMLFTAVGDRAVEFSLQNVSFPVDVWFIKNDRVIQVMTNLPPCLEQCPIYRSDRPVDYIVQVQAGLTQIFSLGVTDSINIKFQF